MRQIRKMRRKDKALEQAEVLDILEQAEYGVLSTVDEEGMPYGVPVDFVYEEGTIYFHCAREGYKIENIRKNPEVSFCVITDVSLLPAEFNTRFRSVIAFGTVREVTEEAERLKIFRRIVAKFSPDYQEGGEAYIRKAGDQAGIYAIQVEYMTGKGKK